MSSEQAQRIFKSLALRYPTPARVQGMLRRFTYQQADTMRSAAETWHSRRAHCLEATMLAAAVMEHRGYPPLVLSIDSVDLIGHVLFIFRGPRGWGAIGKSREEGLHGRAPVFKTIRALAWSYVDPFIDDTGRVTGYATASLADFKSPWRDSPRNVWKVENYLIDLKHTPIRIPKSRYRRLRAYFDKHQCQAPQPYWW